MSEVFKPIETAGSLPVADISYSNTGVNGTDQVTTNYQYDVKRPAEYQNDFIIEVKASQIRRIKEKIANVSESKYPIHEILLGVSSVSIGAFLSALISGVKLDSCLGIIMYLICPVIASGTGVAYFFTRYMNLTTIKDLASSIDENLIDPDDVI